MDKILCFFLGCFDWYIVILMKIHILLTNFKLKYQKNDEVYCLQKNMNKYNIYVTIFINCVK